MSISTLGIFEEKYLSRNVVMDNIALPRGVRSLQFLVERHLLASVARPSYGGTTIARGRYKMLPHLLVVGVRNSDDQGPDGSCKRLSGERGGGGGPISGEIGPSPPSHGSLTPPGLTSFNLGRLKEMEEDCYTISSREALPCGWHIVV